MILMGRGYKGEGGFNRDISREMEILDLLLGGTIFMNVSV